MFSQVVRDPSIDPEVLGAPGLPRPMFRGVPIPFTARLEPGELDLIESDPTLWNAVLREKRCVLCGESIDEERAWVFVDAHGECPSARGALHPRCGRITAAWCVWVRRHLLAGDILAASCATEVLRSEGVLVQGTTDEELAADGIIAEYRIPRRYLRRESIDWVERIRGGQNAPREGVSGQAAGCPVSHS